LLAQPNNAAPVTSATSTNYLKTLFAAPTLKLDAGGRLLSLQKDEKTIS